MLKKLAGAALAITILAPAFTHAASAAPTTGPEGRKCGYDSNTDPNTEAGPGDMVGVVYAGPLAGSGYIVCTVQVNGPTHADADSPAKVVGDPGTGAAYVAPTQVSYNSPEGSQDYLCTEFHPTAGGVLYWDAVNGVWDTSSSVSCGAALQFTTKPVVDLINSVLEGVDPLLCDNVLKPLNGVFGDPAGAVYVNSEGDVYVGGVFVYDCPPYTP
jgi:hypothetical protein